MYRTLERGGCRGPDLSNDEALRLARSRGWGGSPGTHEWSCRLTFQRVVGADDLDLQLE